MLSIVGFFCGAAVSAIVAAEIEPIWKQSARPFLQENSLEFIVFAVDFLSGFWGGVLVTLMVFWLCKKLFPNGLPALRILKGEVSTKDVGSSPLKNVEKAMFKGDLVDVQPSELDDFDLCIRDILVRGKLSDDGVDVTASIRYRNRSNRPLRCASPKAEIEIGGKRPTGKMTHGISGDLRPAQDTSIRFGEIRLYEAKPVSGKASFSVWFGGVDEQYLTSLLTAEFEFTVASFPPDKSTDAVLDLSPFVKTVQYYKRVMS